MWQKGVKVIKTGFPVIHFYDQDFVDIYNKTWLWLGDFWKKGNKKNGFQSKYYCYPESTTINQFEACLSTFFLVYSNSTYSPTPALDNFYNKQEDSGAIRGVYNEADGTPVNPLDGTKLDTETKKTFKDPNPAGSLMPGDYTLTNSDAIKAKVGDPRWLP